MINEDDTADPHDLVVINSAAVYTRNGHAVTARVSLSISSPALKGCTNTKLFSLSYPAIGV